MKLTLFTLIGGLILASCGEDKEPSSPTPTSVISNNGSENKGPKTYKTMFGPDYQKGDIGHSTGIILSDENATNVVVIDHGTIHGIERGADITKFEILDGVDPLPMSSGVKVEFLVKKGADNVYRLFAICEVLDPGKSCL